MWECTLEITRESKSQSNTTLVNLALDGLPGSHQHYSFGRIGAWTLQDAIYILSDYICSGSPVGVLLARGLEAGRFHELLQPLAPPV